MATLFGDNTTLIAAVSRSAGKLDIFTCDTQGQIWTAAWEPGFTQWGGPWLINTNNSRTGSRLSAQPVYAVSRSTDKLDIFTTDLNGVIQTAAWQPGFSEWSEWRQVAGGVSAFSSPVTAVSRSTDKLDIFVVVPTGTSTPRRGNRTSPAIGGAGGSSPTPSSRYALRCTPSPAALTRSIFSPPTSTARF